MRKPTSPGKQSGAGRQLGLERRRWLSERTNDTLINKVFGLEPPMDAPLSLVPGWWNALVDDEAEEDNTDDE